MADIIKTKHTVALNAEFVDGDTRTLTITNPKAEITAVEIATLNSKAAGVIVGDKAGANFDRFASMTNVRRTTTYHDLT